MTEDDFDGAQSQPLRPVYVENVTTGARIPFRTGPVEAVRELGVVPVDKPTVTVVMHKDAAALRASISAEDLEAWRAAMRAAPPEPAVKPGKRPESAWEKPQEWNRP